MPRSFTHLSSTIARHTAPARVSGVRPVPRVGVAVPHLRHVLEADLRAAERPAHVTGGEVAVLGHRGTRRRLGLPVPAMPEAQRRRTPQWEGGRGEGSL